MQTLNHKPHAYFQYLQFLKSLKVELSLYYRKFAGI